MITTEANPLEPGGRLILIKWTVVPEAFQYDHKQTTVESRSRTSMLGRMLTNMDWLESQRVSSATGVVLWSGYIRVAFQSQTHVDWRAS
jgi:hypothetical protein